jgi:hypothetical protein
MASPHNLLPYCMLGTWQEIRYTLMTFGLPVDAFPITHDEDDFSLDNHMDWLSRREELEACFDDSIDKGGEWRITEPGPLDVLMGRGYEAQIHPGNIRYRTIIAESQQVYENSLIHEKTVIAKGIVRLIKEKGGRFLQQDGHDWKLVDDEKARAKVSSVFRDFIRKAKSVPPNNAAAISESTKPTSPADAESFIEQSGFAKLEHSLNEGVINPSEKKRIKTNPSPST